MKNEDNIKGFDPNACYYCPFWIESICQVREKEKKETDICNVSVDELVEYIHKEYKELKDLEEFEKCLS